MQYLVAYDIPDNGRRNRVARCLLNFGRRLQLSVFTCDLETRDFLRMCRKVEALLDFKEDRLHIIPLCQSCAERMTARGPQITEPDDFAIWVL